MGKKQITEEELIFFKQDIQQKYPGSVGKIPGKGDAIFLQRGREDDVIIYTTGTAIYSPTFLSRPSPTKYANMKVAFDVAVSRGYRPSNAFASGWFEQRKLLIKEAKEKFTEETSVFDVVEIKPLREIKAEYGGDNFTPQPTKPLTYDRISQRPQMINSQPRFFGRDDPDYVSKQLIKDYGNRKPYVMKRRPGFTTAVGEFSGMMGAGYAAENRAWGKLAQTKKTTKKTVGRPKKK